MAAVFVFLSLFGCGDPRPEADWTVMVYMAGDNNLSMAASRDLAEMEQVGSTGRVNVVVQVDTLEETSRRVFVRKGGSILEEDLGEKNMADSGALTDFILWAGTHHPAHRYALILWSHGDGFAKALPPLRRILQDDTDQASCCLSNRAVRRALEEGGVHFDLLGFDASQMGQIETAYEFRDRADLLLFSQETGQENGWDYTALLNALAGNPSMTGEKLAETVVESYRQFYAGGAYPSYLTLSAVRLGTEIDELASRIDEWSGLMTAGLNSGEGATFRGAIGAAWSETGEMNPLTAPHLYVDLMSFMEKFQNRLETDPAPSLLMTQLLEQTGVILSKRERVILSEYHGSDRPEATGLSIVFFKIPEALESAQTYSAYLNYFPDPANVDPIRFIQETRWDDFLLTYYRVAGLL